MVDPIMSNQKPCLGIGIEITEFLQNEQVTTPHKLFAGNFGLIANQIES